MGERGLTRRGALAGLAVLSVVAWLAVGVAPAGAHHRPGCNASCRQLGGAGAGPGPPPPPRTALLHHRVYRHAAFVDVQLRCVREHHSCRGVIELDARNTHAPRLSRVNLYVPAGKTWIIELRLSHAGLAYLKAHPRVRGFLFLTYPGDQIDSFRVTIIR